MFYAIPNLASSRTVECTPWNVKSTAPPKARWNNPDVKHTFYSGYEGLIAGARIDSKNNPAVMLHWIVADYDGNIDQHMRDSVLERCIDFRPQYICRTFSGGARLLWKLEAPFPLHNNELSKKLMRYIRKKLRLSKLLVGLDAEALDDPCKYYEAGTEWERLSDDEIPAAFMMQWSIESSRNYAWPKLGPVIPTEVLNEEIERQYPGRWEGPFDFGARGIRFWDPDADNETAAIVRESGMQCFTGGRAFVPWAAILGRKFVKKFVADRIGGSIADVYFDGRECWMQLPDGNWESYCKSDMAMILKVERGLRGSPARGENFSEVEQALTRIMQHQRIACAAPLVHRPQGIVMVGTDRVLNTSSINVLQPAEVVPQASSLPSSSASQCTAGGPPAQSAPPPNAQCLIPDACPYPWLHNFFTGFFDPPEQLDYFYAWLQRWYQSALDGRMLPGQASFFAGVPNTGKTLLSNVVLSRIFGGHIDASSFLSGEDGFNSHLFTSAVWAVDDVVPLPVAYFVEQGECLQQPGELFLCA